NYVGSSQYTPHGSKQKLTVRFDHFENDIEIAGVPYLVKFDVEVFPNVNNYKVHRIEKIKIELSSSFDADTANTQPPQAKKDATLSNKSIPQTVEESNASGNGDKWVSVRGSADSMKEMSNEEIRTVAEIVEELEACGADFLSEIDKAVNQAGGVLTEETKTNLFYLLDAMCRENNIKTRELPKYSSPQTAFDKYINSLCAFAGIGTGKKAEPAEQAKQTEAEKILQRVADEQSEEVRERKAEDADSMTQRVVVIENELEANYRVNIRLAEDFRDGKISKEEFNRRRREILEKNEALILEKNRLLDSVAETADAAYFKDKFLSQPNLSKMSEEEKSKFYLMKRDENEPDYITVARYNAQLVDEYYAEHINPLKERYNELKLTAKEEELVQGLLKDENSAAGLNAELFADVNFGKVYRAAEILKKIRQNSALIEKINLHIDYKTDAVFFVKELEGDSTKGPNSIGISKSIYRNFQTALRNASKECKEFFDREVFQKLAKAKKGFSDGFIHQAEDLRKNVIDLGIKAGSKESAAVQWYGEKQKPVIAGKKFYTKEYTLLDLKKEFGYKMANGKYAWENIVQAEKYFRKQYDAYVYKINDVLRPLFPNPYDKDGNIIPGRRLTPRKDYFHHFIELDDTFGDPAHVLVNTSTEIDPRLLGVSEYTNPKTKWTGFLQRRSDKAAYTADAVGGYLKYMQHAEYKINVEPLISEFTALYRAMQDGAVLSAKPAKKYGINPRNQEPKEYGFAAPGDSGDEYRDSANADVSKNQFLNLFNLFIKDLAGKSNPVDRGVIYNSMGDSKGRKFLNFTDKWVGKAKSAAILGNFGSMVVQIANAKNFGPYVKQKYLVKGLTDGLSMMMGGGKEAAELLHKSQFLQERFMHRSTWGFAGGFAKRAEELAGFCLEVGDKVVAEIGWLGAYYQAVAEGSADPVRRADDITRECVGGRGVGEIPLVMKSRLVSSVLPFQLEVLNNYNVRKDIWQKKGFASKFKGFLTLYVSTYVMNCMFEEILGRRVDFDPISILIELAQNWNDDDDDDDEEEKVNDPNTVEHPILSAVNAPLEKFGGFTDKFIDVFRMFSGEYLSNAPAVSFLLGCFADNENVNEFFGDVSPNRYGTGTIGFNVLIEEFVHLANGDEVDWKSCAAAFVKYGNQLKKFLYFFQDYSLLPDIRYNREEGRLYLNSHEADGGFKFGSNSTGRIGSGGKLSYALDKNPYNIIKDLLFGGTATGSAIDPDAGFTENLKNLLIGGGEDMGGGRGWIKSGFKNGLYANETEAWKAMTGEGTKPEEAKANIDFIKSLPEHFMKVYALDMMDYSAETKGRIYKGIVTQYKSDGEFIDKLLNAGASYEGIYKYYKYVDTCEIMDMKVSYAYALGKTGIPLDKQAEIYFGDEHKCYDSEYDVMETLEGYGLSRKDYYSVLQAGYNVSVWPGDEKNRLDKYIPKALEAGVSAKDILLVMAAKSTFDGKFYENHGYNVKYANSRAVKLISDLKLSSKQKDALHRLYWADSSLRFAPWHGGKSGWSGDAGITAKEAGFGNNSYAAQAVVDAVNRKNRRSGVSPVITLPNGRKQTSFTNKFNVLFWEYLE
ncbi:MAG: hypothetical protein ACOX7J_07220, partial [Bacillota bacterium]